MGSFELLDHTADVGLRARGESLADLLAACAEGMFAILAEGEVHDTRSVAIELEAGDAEELVHAWLRELLFRFEVERVVFGRFDVRLATPVRLQAICHGEPFDPERHEGRAEIKAVTYHGFRVEQDAAGWVAEVLFDI
jgi:SHS2 domain-containing protein